MMYKAVSTHREINVKERREGSRLVSDRLFFSRGAQELSNQLLLNFQRVQMSNMVHFICLRAK